MWAPTSRQVVSSTASCGYESTALSASSPATPVVFVVEDDASVRQALESLISSSGWRAETFASGIDFLASPRPLSPSCLVLDVMLPLLNGLELQDRLRAERPELPIVFVTGYGDVPTTVLAMKRGAVDFLTKPFRDHELLEAIRRAVEKSRAMIRDRVETSALLRRYASLSHREREVMALVVAGRLNKQTASELRISEVTVKAHRGRVMRKMKASSLAHLVSMAARVRADSDSA